LEIDVNMLPENDARTSNNPHNRDTGIKKCRLTVAFTEKNTCSADIKKLDL